MLRILRLPALDQVIEILSAQESETLLMAGGTDILPRPAALASTRLLIDLSQVAELQGIALDAEGRIRIGAAVTHQEIVDHPLIQRKAQLLSMACSSIGSVQIRNLGTIGGNLANASPAADSLPALVCLAAEVALASPRGIRFLPVSAFILGPGRTARAADELIESVRIPVVTGRRVAFFKKAGQRRGMCCAKASVAMCAHRHGDGRLTKPRVAMGAVAATVISVPAAERVLADRVLTMAVIEEAAAACCEAAQAIDDIRSTASYRRHVVGALLTEGLAEIYDHMQDLARRQARRRRRRS